ncbi:hypothetical protein NIES204_45490 (plasmid) [Planktothrix agardhii NIES-204]|jgi:hypothetical protein|nr:hypothetical protein NIES204_45490 [Planktothrix agardhii NIES-204]
MNAKSKRYNITLPPAIGEALDRWAEAERNKPTSLASFLVEQIIRQAMEKGKIPPETKSKPLYRSFRELLLGNIDRLEENPKLRERVGVLVSGEKPTEQDKLRIALTLGLSEETVEKLCEGKNGKQNGMPV